MYTELSYRSSLFGANNIFLFVKLTYMKNVSKMWGKYILKLFIKKKKKHESFVPS